MGILSGDTTYTVFYFASLPDGDQLVNERIIPKDQFFPLSVERIEEREAKQEVINFLPPLQKWH